MKSVTVLTVTCITLILTFILSAKQLRNREKKERAKSSKSLDPLHFDKEVNGLLMDVTSNWSMYNCGEYSAIQPLDSTMKYAYPIVEFSDSVKDYHVALSCAYDLNVLMKMINNKEPVRVFYNSKNPKICRAMIYKDSDLKVTIYSQYILFGLSLAVLVAYFVALAVMKL